MTTQETKQQALLDYGKALGTYATIMLGLAIVSLVGTALISQLSFSSFAGFLMPILFLYIANQIKLQRIIAINGWITAVKVLTILSIIGSVFGMLSFLTLISFLMAYGQSLKLILILVPLLVVIAIDIKLLSAHLKMEKIVR